MATDGDMPVYDTPLHPAIEIQSTTFSTGVVVFYDPDDPRPEKHIRSTEFSDTYDCR